MEVRAKLPQGQGTWPAIWMLPEDARYGPWAASGEIDILEAVNLGVRCEECGDGTENRILGTLHLGGRSEEHTSELQSLMRTSFAVLCLKKKKYTREKQMMTRDL